MDDGVAVTVDDEELKYKDRRGFATGGVRSSVESELEREEANFREFDF